MYRRWDGQNGFVCQVISSTLIWKKLQKLIFIKADYIETDFIEADLIETIFTNTKILIWYRELSENNYSENNYSENNYSENNYIDNILKNDFSEVNPQIIPVRKLWNKRAVHVPGGRVQPLRDWLDQQGTANAAHWDSWHDLYVRKNGVILGQVISSGVISIRNRESSI